MIDLTTLGAVQLEEHLGSGNRPVAVQAKRLALVAYLALAGSGRYRRRDSIVALFWPDLDSEHARGALRQALSYLRRTLGASVLVTRGEDEIAVSREALCCDAVAFDEEVRAGRCEAAMAIYRGDFLDGLFVSDGSPELEQWIAEERARLRTSATTCCRALAEVSREQGNAVAAAEWARRAAAFAPDDEGNLRWSIALFDAMGDRAAAVAEYERFVRRLASDYSAEPSPETQALIAAVRSRSLATDTAPTDVPPPTTTQPAELDLPEARGATTHAGVALPGRRRHAAALAMIGSALAFAGVFGALSYRRGERTLDAEISGSAADGGESLRQRRSVTDPAATHALGSRVAEAPAATLTAGTRDPAARDSYIRGRYYWNKRGRAGLLRAVGFFTAALDRDPTFALAYSGMGDAYVQLGYGSLLQPADAFPKARAAAERALQLDSTLAEPHATLGFVRMYYDWDWAGAEREFRRALQLEPGYATGHEWYGLFLAAMGRFNEALEHERRAQALDPLSTAVAGTAAWVLYYAGRKEEAERELRVALRQDSAFALGHFYLGRVHQARGRLDEALVEYQAAGSLRDWVPTIAAVGHVYGTQGRRREALEALAHLDTLSRQEYVTAYAVALVHASLGQRDSAFTWLDRGVAERTHWMVWLRLDPRWAPIRADPRFEAIARRLKLPR